MSCERSITFIIPGKNGAPGIQVTVVEVADGALAFTVDVLGVGGGLPGDLQGLFFDVNDDSKLAGLAVSGSSLITGFDTIDVINLGNGVNMNGAADPFDVGIKFGTSGIGQDDIQTATFTLSNTAGNLTLDDIAHVEFGARTTSTGAKLTTIAPAAPDAVDDAYNIFEDGQSGLNDPSTVPEGVLFDVLANDTDADGDTLTVTEVFGALHGTAEIVDGDDADLLPGDAVLYTPFEDYSGSDTFTYCISDNNGGTDFAEVTVAIEAVADVPDLQVQILAGNSVNEIRLIVTATQTDADSSEFIDRILTGPLDPGVTIVPVSVNPGTEPDQIVQEFLLTVPLNQDTDFDLTITAVSKETSNGDEETASQTIDIVYEYNTATQSAEFLATDQSIWSTGDQFVFIDDRFVGVNTGNFDKSTGSVLYAGASGHIKLGFQSTLTFEGGEIDATADYDVTVETNYNKTTDQLLIDTGAFVTAASMFTQGPEGSYTLDFVYDVSLSAFAGVDVDFGSIDLPDPLGSFDLGGLQKEIPVGPVGVGPGDFNLIDLTSDNLEGTIQFPFPLNSLSVNYDWPDIETAGAFPPNPVLSAGASNNFLELVLDVDTLATQLLGLPNVFDPPELSAGPFFADIDLLDVDVIGGLNFLQDFELSLGDLTGILAFEDGSSQLFTIGDSWLINNASDIDAGGDGDGLVEFSFALVPTASLHNDTDLGFNIGAEMSLLSVELGYDVSIDVPVIGNVGFSDSITLGPLADFGETQPIGAIGVYDDTFALAFDLPSELQFFA
jgi:hypothetical protein